MTGEGLWDFLTYRYERSYKKRKLVSTTNDSDSVTLIVNISYQFEKKVIKSVNIEIEILEKC